jgi:hypothetical protein
MNSFDLEDSPLSRSDYEVVNDTNEESGVVTISEPLENDYDDQNGNEEEENYCSVEEIDQCEDMEILRDSIEELGAAASADQKEEGAGDDQQYGRTGEASVKRTKKRSNSNASLVVELKRDRKGRTLEGYVTSGFQSKAFREKIHKKKFSKPQQLKSEKVKEGKQAGITVVGNGTAGGSNQRRSGRRSRTLSEKVQPKTLSSPPAVMTEAMTKAKEKQWNELENSLISSYFKKKAAFAAVSSVSLPRKLPEGHAELTNLSTAISTSVNHYTSLLLPSDWNDKSSALALIGWICKVYWDGEDQWYYARILNYDFNCHRYYVRKKESSFVFRACFLLLLLCFSCLFVSPRCLRFIILKTALRNGLILRQNKC